LTPLSTNVSLEHAFPNALLGVETAIISFFDAFLSGPLYVPERKQRAPLSNVPRYPNEFLNILGISERERTIVPVFSSAQKMNSWFGTPLAYRTLSGQELLSLIPEGWWIAINSRDDFEKEISPWEIENLKEGRDGIPAVVAEILEAERGGTLNLAPVKDSEYLELRTSLTEFASRTKNIEEIFIAVEEQDGSPLRILIGVQQGRNASTLEDVKQLVKKSLIGDLPSEIIDMSTDQLLSGALRHFSLYKNQEPKKSFVDSIGAFIGKGSKR